MSDTDDKKVKEKEDEVLWRMLNTPPTPHKEKREPAKASPRRNLGQKLDKGGER